MPPALEERLEDQLHKSAEQYFKTYKPQMEALEKHSAISKVRAISPMDYYALGKMLESWDNLKSMCEADGSVGDLGILPRIALDVITVAYGTSPISVIASVQPIDEELGTVYYKALKALDTKGNVTANDTIMDVEGGLRKVTQYYAGAEIVVSHGTTVDADLTYSWTETILPIRPGTFSVLFATGPAPASTTLTDDSNGNLIGVGGYGTINYTTGAVDITLLTNPTVGHAITSTFSQNVEGAADVPEIQYELTSKAVRAKVYALKGTVGMLKSYALRKRFGMVAEDELAVDLTNSINSEVFGDLLRKMYAAQTGNTDWSKTPPTTVSYFEHKQTFKDYMATAESVLVGNAGRGTISWIVAGLEVAAIISTLPGFVKLYDGNTISGAHIYGTLDGVPVIRVPLTSLLPAAKAIFGFKGQSAFEAPACYSPYMPLTVTSLLPLPNPLLQQRAAAVWAGVEILVSNFLTGFTVTA